jgi:hypothetical protein
VAYYGNKRREFPHLYEKHLKNLLDGSSIDTIVEPFAGTSACSYAISRLYPNKFKYILNDNDEQLMELYRVFSDEKKLNDFIECLQEKIKDIDREKYLRIVKEKSIMGWFIKRKIYAYHPGAFPVDYKPKDFSKLKTTPVNDFLRTENITLLCQDGQKLIDQYKDHSNILFIVDPPYMDSCNDFYSPSTRRCNIYEYYYKNPIKSMKCHHIIVLNDCITVRLLFTDSISEEYDKMYENTKKRCKHLVIKSFNC